MDPSRHPSSPPSPAAGATPPPPTSSLPPVTPLVAAMAASPYQQQQSCVCATSAPSAPVQSVPPIAAAARPADERQVRSIHSSPLPSRPPTSAAVCSIALEPHSPHSPQSPQSPHSPHSPQSPSSRYGREASSSKPSFTSNNSSEKCRKPSFTSNNSSEKCRNEEERNQASFKKRVMARIGSRSRRILPVCSRSHSADGKETCCLSTPLRRLRSSTRRPSLEDQKSRVTSLLSESLNRSVHSRRDTVGVNGKEFHFFLSHKKKHSHEGAVHAQIATHMADKLRTFGFNAFLDIDNLTEITASALRENIEKSCAMVVLLHDETHLSDWCQLEWKVAAELDLPICVVIDMERASKSQELARMQHYPNFLRYKWIEYSDLRRREAVDEISEFLTRHTLAMDSADDNSSATSRDFSQVDFYYYKIRYLMMFGGVDIAPQANQSWQFRAWCWLVRTSTYVCLLTCLMRLLYAHGPAFTDRASALATVMIHFHLISAPCQVRRIVASRTVQRLLRDIFRAADLSEIHAASHLLFRLGAVLVPVVLLLYLLSWEPLFFSHLYIGADRSPLERAFGWGSGVLFLNGIITQIPLLICVHIMSSLIKLMACVPCEAAADKLHPRIAAVGLRRYVQRLRRNFSYKRDAAQLEAADALVSNGDEPILITDEAMTNFQRHWQMGCAISNELNSALWPMHNVMLVWAGCCFAVPLSLAINSHLDANFVVDRFPGEPRYIFYLNCLRIVFIWLQGPLLLTIEWVMDAWINFRLAQTCEHIGDLVFTKPGAYTFVRHVAKLKRSFYFSSLRIPITPRVCGVLVLLSFLSAIPFGFVRWSAS